jgi:hypothetical protein
MISQGNENALSMKVYNNPRRNPAHLILIIQTPKAGVLLTLDEFFATRTVRPAKNSSKTGAFSLF